MKIEPEAYRKIDKISASAIKLFDKDRMQFYKEFILKENLLSTTVRFMRIIVVFLKIQ